MSLDHRRERIRCLQELGLGERASDDEIKKAYKTAALKLHPDKNSDPEAHDKFKKITAAYRYLTEGDTYVKVGMEDEDLYTVFRYMFPWMFQAHPLFRTQPFDHNPIFRTYYDYDEDVDSDDVEIDDSDEDSYNYQPLHKPQPAMNVNHDPPTAHNAGSPFAFTSTASSNESSVKNFSRPDLNFTTANEQHGQFYHETRAAKKSAKKRNRNAKKATKLAADTENKVNAAEKCNDPSSERNHSYAMPSLKPGSKDASPEKSSIPKIATNSSPSMAPGNSEKSSQAEDLKVKKSKKQILMEQKQREKEANEIRKELEEQERKKHEKMERAKMAQIEKERKEREAREEEERKQQEAEMKKEEERRKMREIEEQRKKKWAEEAAKKKEQEERMKRLAQEFDKDLFLDDTGDFKYTDPDLFNVIRNKDTSSLGNANTKTPGEKVKVINGLLTEDLIKLQTAKPTPNALSHKSGTQRESRNLEHGDRRVFSQMQRPNLQYNPRPIQTRVFENTSYSKQAPSFSSVTNKLWPENFYSQPPPPLYPPGPGVTLQCPRPLNIPDLNIIRNVPPPPLLNGSYPVNKFLGYVQPSYRRPRPESSSHFTSRT